MVSVLTFKARSKTVQVISGDVHIGDIVVRFGEWQFDSFGSFLSSTDMRSIVHYISKLK